MESIESIEAIRVIDLLGGTTSVSKICSISLASVSAWKKRGIPKGWYEFFKCQFPHLFNPQEE